MAPAGNLRPADPAGRESSTLARTPHSCKPAGSSVGCGSPGTLRSPQSVARAAWPAGCLPARGWLSSWAPWVAGSESDIGCPALQEAIAATRALPGWAWNQRESASGAGWFYPRLLRFVEREGPRVGFPSDTEMTTDSDSAPGYEINGHDAADNRTSGHSGSKPFRGGCGDATPGSLGGQLRPPRRDSLPATEGPLRPRSSPGAPGPSSSGGLVDSGLSDGIDARRASRARQRSRDRVRAPE